MGEEERFTSNISKTGQGWKAQASKKVIIKKVLEELGQKEPFDVGDLVTTLEGDYAHIGLMVVELKNDDIVMIAPAPNAPTIEIHKSKLFHFNDYRKAFEVALAVVLVKEYIQNQPQ